MLNGRTKVCVIIGDPIAHTLSPAFHGAGYRALGIDGEYVFIGARVVAADLTSAVAGARAMNFHAVTCTMPHKEAVLPLLDEVDAAARKIGAVNSIVNRAGRFIGYNTDWVGVTAPLQRRRDLAGVGCAVIGAGGTARAAVYGLRERGAEVTVFNRTVERAERLAADLGCDFGGLDEMARIAAAQIVVQTTSVGLDSTTASPVSPAVFRPGQIVLDVVYRSKPTPFLVAAAAAGADTVRGEEVFIEQGLAQFELYTGRVPPRAPLEAVVRGAL